MRSSALRNSRRAAAGLACAALLLSACSNADNADGAAPTPSPAASTAAPTSPAASTAASTGEDDHADHDHEDGHDHGDEESPTGSDDHGHDHTPADVPLDAATVGWYTDFCSTVDGVALQPGAGYTVQSPPEEIRDAHVEWLTGIETDADAYIATMEAAGTPAIDGGAELQADLLVTLRSMGDGAAESAALFESGAPIDGLEAGNEAWLEKALTPYTEGVAPFHDYLSFNEEALMPGEHEAQIVEIGVCGSVLHVH